MMAPITAKENEIFVWRSSSVVLHQSGPTPGHETSGVNLLECFRFDRRWSEWPGCIRCRQSRCARARESRHSQYAHCVRMIAAALARGLVDAGGPGTGMAGIVCKTGDCPTQAVVASPSEGDGATLAGLVGDGYDASL